MASTRYPGHCGICERDRPRVARSKQLGFEVCDGCYTKHLQPRYECRYCKRRLPRTTRTEGGESVCNDCYFREYHQAECAGCGVVRDIRLRDEDGRPFCSDCYKKTIHVAECGGCGEQASIARRVEDVPYCNACYRRDFQEKVACVFCTRVRHVAFRGPAGEPVCAACWTRELNRAVCTLCGVEGSISARTEDGGPICQACYRTKVAEKPPCASCGKARKVVRRLEDGSPLCGSCWARLKEKETCIVCGKESAVQRRTPEGPIGACCYVKPKKKCGFCDGRRIVAGYADDGRPACQSCTTIVPELEDEASVKSTLSPSTIGFIGACVKSATGGAMAVYVIVAVSVRPTASLTESVIVYVPGLAYEWTGWTSVLWDSSPKFHT